jgi:hypothetical protein
MRIGDLVPMNVPMRLFPVTAFPPASGADQDGYFPQSIGQEAGRSTMTGDLPGRYYGSDWLAPNSGYATVASSISTGNGNQEGDAAATADGAGTLGPISLTNPLPSVVAPRQAQQTVPACGVAAWVSGNPVLAVGAAVFVFFVFRGGRQ